MEQYFGKYEISQMIYFYYVAGVSFVTSYKCVESTDEIETKEEEKGFQVACFIGQDVKYLHTGIQKV